MLDLSTCRLIRSLEKFWSIHKWRGREEEVWRHPLKQLTLVMG